MIKLQLRKEKTANNAQEAPKPPKTPKEKKVKSAGAKKGAVGSKKRFVFMIGDEGAILVYLEGKAVVKRIFCSSVDMDNISGFRQLLEGAPAAPIYALIDMMDQSYMRQTLPPVTKLSVNKLIKRRLERDFGPEDITGALPLGRESGGRKDWNYMLVSLASSPQLMQWLDFILEYNNPFEGLYLVPIEAAIFMRELSKFKLGKEASPWQLLVCHNKVGGFRQVIMREGKLTFTRLAQPIGDTSPEIVAGNIEQEISNTIEYLKRLSYTEDAGLDCFIVVSMEIQKYIEASKIKARNVVVLTPFEVSEALSLPKAALPEDHYADVVFSSFFALNSRKVLPLYNKLGKQLLDFRRNRRTMILGSSFLMILLGIISTYNVTELLPRSEEIAALEQQISQLSALIADANSKVSTLPANIDQMEDVVSLHKIFADDKDKVISFIKSFYKAAAGDVIVTNLNWKDDSKLEDRFNQLPANIRIDVNVEFLVTTGSVDDFALKARKFFERMRLAFPEYTMTYSKLPGIIDQAQSFQAEFNEASNSTRQDMLSGEPIIVTLQFTTPKPDQPPL